MIRRSLNAIESEGIDARIKTIARILPNQEQRIDTIRMCLSICASDGDIAPDELEILKKMQAEFDLSETQMEKLLNE